jgi:hypothetical protein
MEELDVLRLVEEQGLANKKKNNEARKLQEEEDKRKKDKEDYHKQIEEVADAATIAAQEKKKETAVDEPDRNFNKNLHSVFNGVATELEAPEGEAPDEQRKDAPPRIKEQDLVRQAAGATPTRSHPLKQCLKAPRRRFPLKRPISTHTRELSSNLRFY